MRDTNDIRPFDEALYDEPQDRLGISTTSSLICLVKALGASVRPGTRSTTDTPK